MTEITSPASTTVSPGGPGSAPTDAVSWTDLA